MDQKFFGVPFANGGDKTSIPVPVQPSGVVSYTSGWGFDYQRTMGTDPDAKPIPRQGMNQLFYDITNALSALQRQAFPEWVAAADNEGVALAYGAGVVVMYDVGGAFVPYVSLVPANTAEPSTDPTKWQQLLYQESSQVQAETGTNATTVMTPRRVAQAIAALGAAVPDATTLIAGKTRYATTAETTAGAVTDAAVTPAGLTNFMRTTGASVTGTYNFRDRAIINIYDDNDDVTVGLIRGGISAVNDRGLLIHNANPTGNVQIQAGNSSFIFTMAPTTWSMNRGGEVGGDLDVTGTVTSSGNFISASGAVAVCSGSTGQVWLRPNGIGNSTGQLQVATNGAVTINGSCTATGGFQPGSSMFVKDLDGEILGASELLARIVPQWGRYLPSYCADGRRRAFLVAEQLREVGASVLVFEDAIDEFPMANEEAGESRGRKLPGVDYDQGVALLIAGFNEERQKRIALEERLAVIEALLNV